MFVILFILSQHYTHKALLKSYNSIVNLDQGDSINTNEYCASRAIECLKCKNSYLF